MPKNALFLLKNRKNRRALEAPTPDSRIGPTPMTKSWLRA